MNDELFFDKLFGYTKEYVVNPLLAGLAIGIASVCFLKSGLYLGMFLFAFGLSTVVLSKWKLFTGMAGFTNNMLLLFSTLGVNIIGAALAANFSWGSDLTQAADKIVEARINYGFIGCMVNAVACGFIMTVSVKYARQNQWLPLLLGVPTFIICGFPHCIADIGYYSLSSHPYLEVVWLWVASVIGNFVGCKIPTIIDSPVSSQ